MTIPDFSYLNEEEVKVKKDTAGSIPDFSYLNKDGSETVPPVKEKKVTPSTSIRLPELAPVSDMLSRRAPVGKLSQVGVKEAPLTLSDFVTTKGTVPMEISRPMEIPSDLEFSKLGRVALGVGREINKAIEKPGEFIGVDVFGGAGHLMAQPFVDIYKGVHESILSMAGVAQLIEGVTGIKAEIIDKALKDEWSKHYNNETAAEARRGFLAALLSLVTAGFASSLAKQTLLKYTSLGGAIETSGSPLMRAAARSIERQALTELPKNVQRIPSHVAGGVAGFTYGFIGSKEGERTSNALAYSLLSVPLGLAFHAFESSGVTIPETAKADVLNTIKQVRAFDEQAPKVTEIEVTDNLNLVEKPVINLAEERAKRAPTQTDKDWALEQVKKNMLGKVDPALIEKSIEELKNTPAFKDLAEYAAGERRKNEVALPTTAVTEKDILKMPMTQVTKLWNELKIQEANIDKDVLGDKLGEYNQAQRIVNSSTIDLNSQRYKNAEATINRIESSLTPEQQNKLFGIGQKGVTAEDLQPLVNNLQDLMHEPLRQAPTDELIARMTHLLGGERSTSDLYLKFASLKIYEELMRRNIPQQKIIQATLGRMGERGITAGTSGEALSARIKNLSKEFGELQSLKTESISKETKVLEFPEQPTIQSSSDLASDLISSNADMVSTIIKSIKETNPKDVRIIPGASNPTEAIRQAREILTDPIVSMYKREDGKYDIAIGGNKSDLKGSRAQFEKDGFYEGQTVDYNGKNYKYLSRGSSADKAYIRPVGEEGRFEVGYKEIKRLPYTPAEVRLESGILKEAESILEPHEFLNYKRLYEKLIDPEIQKPLNIEEQAGVSGFKVTMGGAGDFQIRDQQTDALLKGGIYTPEEVNKFIKDAGSERGSDLLSSEVEYNSDLARVFNVKPPTRPRNPINVSSDGLPPKKGEFKASLGDRINIMTPWATPVDKYVASVDAYANTDLYSMVHDLRQARTLMDFHSRDGYKELGDLASKIWDSSPDDRMFVVGRHMEQASADEILQGALGRKLSTKAISYAEQLRDLEIDTSKVGKYVREFRGEVDSLKERLSLKTLPDDVLKSITTELTEKYNMTPRDLMGVKIANEVIAHDLDELSWFEIKTLADAWQHNAPSQAEYARLNRMSPAELKLSNGLSDLLRRLGSDAGIDNTRMLGRYLHHMVDNDLHDINLVSFDNLRKSSKGDLVNEKKFAAEMVRAGFADNYERDPVIVAQNYIRNMNYHKYMSPIWEKAQSTLRSELIDAVDSKRLSEAEGREILDVGQEFLNGIRGIPDRATQMTAKIVGGYLEEMGIKSNKDVVRNTVNAALAHSSNAMLGYRIGPAIRDLVVANQEYFVWFGADRAAKFFSHLAPTPENLRARKFLMERGKISSYSSVRFFTPDDLYASRFGKNLKGISGAFQSWAENGLTMSGQKSIYEMTLAAAYMESRGTVIDNLSKLAREEITKEKAYKNIGLSNYPQTVQAAFERLIDRPLEAGDYLGFETHNLITNHFGHANHPRGWATAKGKVLGQFGQYSMWSRVNLIDQMSRGSVSERAVRMARLGVSEAAKTVVGNVTGINLSNWMIVPSVVFGGGPVSQLAWNGANALFGTEFQRADSKRKLGIVIPTFLEPKRIQSGDLNVIFDDPRSILIPGSWALHDVLEASKLTNSGGDPFRISARLLGVPVMAPKPWYEDMYQWANVPFAAARWAGIPAELPRP